MDTNEPAGEHPGEPPSEATPSHPPIEFHATDRYHAITVVEQHLEALGVVARVRERLAEALRGMTHLGPVHVVIPAPPKAHPAPEPPAETRVDADPTHPDDGAFAVKPFEFVAV